MIQEFFTAALKRTTMGEEAKMEDEDHEMMMFIIKPMIEVTITVLASLTYCFFIVSKIPKSKILRLLALVPVFYLNLLLPLKLSSSSVHLTGIVAFSISWLCNLKLLLFAFNQGPLSSSSNTSTSDHNQLSFLRFISIASLPLLIKQNPSPKIITQKNPDSNLQITTLRALIFALLVQIYDYREQIHPSIIVLIYCSLVYLFSEIVLGICAVLGRTLMGLDLEQQFDEPYLSTSLQDFWGRRWNLVAMRSLRSTVFIPVRRICTGIKWGPDPALMGLLATFTVSGLLHELMYYYITLEKPTWEVTWFFLVHGIFTGIEICVKKRFNGWCRFLHPVVSRALVLGFVFITSYWLYFPQLLRKDVDLRLIEEYSGLSCHLKHGIVKLWAWAY